MKKVCQSCAMPLDKDPQKGGTNANGTKSTKFCSYCFQNGKFTYECDNVCEFQEHCLQAMKKNGFNPILAWLFSRGLSRLERWKK